MLYTHRLPLSSLYLETVQLSRMQGEGNNDVVNSTPSSRLTSENMRVHAEGIQQGK